MCGSMQTFVEAVNMGPAGTRQSLGADLATPKKIGNSCAILFYLEAEMISKEK